MGQAIQVPLPTIGGPARITATRKKLVPLGPLRWTEGTLPLRWSTIIDPADVLVNMVISGNPQPTERVQFNRKTGTAYTPARTRQAELRLRTALREAYLGAPVEGPVGVIVVFRRGDANRADGDNLLKLVCDSASKVVFVDDQQVTHWQAHVVRNDPLPRSEILFWRIRPHPPLNRLK